MGLWPTHCQPKSALAWSPPFLSFYKQALGQGTRWLVAAAASARARHPMVPQWGGWRPVQRAAGGQRVAAQRERSVTGHWSVTAPSRS